MRYQETWVRGEVDTNHAFQRPCAPRYPAIRTALDGFSRPFSVFDLGANLGYFSFRIANDYPATCVMADTRPELGALCVKNRLPSTLWLNRRLTVQDLHQLADAEHFDVVLALSVLHHFDDKCCEALDALLDLGMLVIVESAGRDDVGSLNHRSAHKLLDHIATLPEKVELLAEHPSHKSGVQRPMYVIHTGPHRALTRQTIDATARGAPPIDVQLNADYGRCDVLINHTSCWEQDGEPQVEVTPEARPFIPGMNLWNFIQLNGVWPRGWPTWSAMR